MNRRVERILTPQRLDELWVELYPLFDKCCKKAMHGEMLPNDIKELAKAGKATIFAFFKDDRVVLAMAMEFVPFPRMLAANVFALGGEDFGAFTDAHWGMIANWLQLNGVKAVDAWVSPSMVKMITRKLGFEQVYHHMRLRIGD